MSTKKSHERLILSELTFSEYDRRLLYDAAGERRWITVTEDSRTRFLTLDGCEQGAMHLSDEHPVFDYLWFHKCSHLVQHPVLRTLILGAGAFTTAKCLALDHPEAVIGAIDEESDLERIGRAYFRLDERAYANVKFHPESAESFLASIRAGRASGRQADVTRYDFIFDDLFDGFQHVPESTRDIAYLHQLAAALKEGGVCVKNLIWSPQRADPRAACQEVWAAWRAAFTSATQFALGDASRGHNRMLVGAQGTLPPLESTGIPAHVLDQVTQIP